jgi:hypothetical protein
MDLTVVLSLKGNDFVGSAFTVDQQFAGHKQFIGGTLPRSKMLDGCHIALGANGQSLFRCTEADRGKRAPRRCPERVSKNGPHLADQIACDGNHEWHLIESAG